MENITVIQSLIRPGWRMLGELELPVDVSMETAIHAWLIEVLHVLDLSAEFLNKICTSAQEAAARAVQTDHVAKFRHLHLIAFAPANVPSKAGNWGFFRIEKMESRAHNSSPDHAIEFYLYLE